MQVLDGEKAVEFLRFRKNNNGTGYPGGDLDRNKSQQAFMKSAFKKSLSIRLPIVAATVIKNVKTDLTLIEAGKWAASAMGVSADGVTTYSLPGEAMYLQGLSFFFADTEKTEELLKHIYDGDSSETTDSAVTQ